MKPHLFLYFYQRSSELILWESNFPVPRQTLNQISHSYLSSWNFPLEPVANKTNKVQSLWPHLVMFLNLFFTGRIYILSWMTFSTFLIHECIVICIVVGGLLQAATTLNAFLPILSSDLVLTTSVSGLFFSLVLCSNSVLVRHPFILSLPHGPLWRQNVSQATEAECLSQTMQFCPFCFGSRTLLLSWAGD